MTNLEGPGVFTADLRRALPVHHTLCEGAWLKEIVLQLAMLRYELAASRGQFFTLEELLGDLAGAQAPPGPPTSGGKEDRQ